MSTHPVSNYLITISFCASYTLLETPYIMFFFVHRLSEMSILKLRALNKLKALGMTDFYLQIIWPGMVSSEAMERRHPAASQPASRLCPSISGIGKIKY
jgi:hypothetical protein